MLVDPVNDSVALLDAVIANGPLAPAPLGIAPSAIAVDAAPNISFSPGDRLRLKLAPAGGHLVPVRSIGKLRVLARTDDGDPAGSAEFRVVTTDQNGTEREVAKLTTDRVGYATVDLSSVMADGLTGLSLVPVNGGGNALEVLGAHLNGIGPAGLPHEIVISPTAPLVPHHGDGHEPSAPTIDFPDAADLRNSPASFDQSIAVEGGADCTLALARNYATRQFFFRQIVREEAPSLQRSNPASRMIIPFDRLEVRRAIDPAIAPWIAHAGHPVLGKLNLYRQAWMPVGHSLGDLLYSLALAPCEETRVAIIEWSRSDRSSRVERTAEAETLRHEMMRDRQISEVLDTVVDEVQEGSSATASGGLGFSIPGFSIGGGGGGSTSTSSGHREVQASTIQNLADTVVQRASAARSLNSTVVTQSSQAEQEGIRTRVVRNHNLNHALTIEYFEVLKHYRVQTQLVEQSDVLLIPYDIPDFLWQGLPDFEAFQQNPAQPVVRWIDHHATLLRGLLPARLTANLESVRRALHCREVYGYAPPAITVSRWTVELQQAWRPAVHLIVRTNDGQSIRLQPHRDEPGSTMTFRSAPVEISSITTIDVSFDPSNPTAATIMGIEIPATYGVRRIRVTAHTDPSEALSTSRSYTIVDRVLGSTIELSAADPATGFSVDPPAIELPVANTRAYRDYCSIREIVAHILEDPMRYLRALWMSEDSDQRAVRFDLFEIDGKPLLDQIQNQPVGMVGNLVAFPLVANGQLKRHTAVSTLIAERSLSLPTRGVFAETLLSRCNATEVRDPSRYIDKEYACSVSAPEISPVAAGSRYQPPQGMTPTAFPSSMISIQNAPNAPDPAGLAAALEVLKTPEIFRDMSLGKETVASVQALSIKALEGSIETQKQAMEIAARIAAASMGIPLPPGGTGSSSGSGGGAGAAAAGAAGAAAGLSASTRGTNAAAGAALRNASPGRVFDQIQNIEDARARGLITDAIAEQATRNILGAPSGEIGDFGDSLASLFGAGAPARARKSSTPAAAATYIGRAFTQPITSPWNLDQAAVAADLQTIVADPDAINQGSFNLCGPAVFLRSWAKRDPVNMAGFAFLLYKNRRGYVGMTKIEPDDDLVGATYDPATAGGCGPAQWMMMSALRDVSNFIMDFEGSPSETVAAATLPGAIENWLEATGCYQSVSDDTNLFVCKEVADALALDPAQGDVLLLINSYWLKWQDNGGGPDTSDSFDFYFPNHWVVLTEKMKEVGSYLRMTCYTWGGLKTVTVPKSVVEANFYGAIVAKP